MPTLPHDGPLNVLREDPALVPLLLQEALGIEVPPYERVDLADADFTQAVPAELRADLVVVLRGGPSGQDPVMGVVIEMQLARDPRKRATWPLYLASLHARLCCPTCLVVVANDESVARWAAQPITDIHPGMVFTPIVLGPSRIPCAPDAPGDPNPWMSVLATLIHHEAIGGEELARRAMAALRDLPPRHALLGYALLKLLAPDMRRALEATMDADYFEYRKWLETLPTYDSYKRELPAFLEGLEKRKTARSLLRKVAELRLGALSDSQRRRVEVCKEYDRLEAAILQLITVTDPAAVERVLAEL